MAVLSTAAADGHSAPLGPAACEADAKKLQFIDELTTNCDAVQVNVLAEILSRNAETEYLRRFKLDGAIDRETFKAKLPVVTYEDLQPDIQRIANGDKSAILSSHPISEFLTSSGTSAGERKLMPTIQDELDRRQLLYSLLMPVMNMQNSASSSYGCVDYHFSIKLLLDLPSHFSSSLPCRGSVNRAQNYFISRHHNYRFGSDGGSQPPKILEC